MTTSSPLLVATIVVAVVILTGLNISFQMNHTFFTHRGEAVQSEGTATETTLTSASADVGVGVGVGVAASPPLSLTPALDIVHKAYNNTFAHFQCPKQQSFKDCLAKMYEKIQSKDQAEQEGMDDKDWEWSLSSSTVQHWWFQTLIRDAGNLGGRFTGLFGVWHIGQATDPNVSMCMIEKIGIKHWTTIFTSLNNNAYYTRKIRSDTNTVIDLPSLPASDGESYPSFVILRDPLDRFLSAFLDKCVDSTHRHIQKHCEPNQIYKEHQQGKDNIKTNPLTAGFSFGGDNDKEKAHGKALFSMYVDTMPLAWNLHFFPQSFYCNGMYRFIDDYDFVGHMDSNFYHDLDKLGRRFGGRFETKLKEVFDYPSKMNNTEMDENVGVETKASDKVMQYYTPRSLRKVLEYVSVDYVLFNLTIPAWAEEMLRNDQGR